MNHHTTDPSRPAQRFSITCPNASTTRWASLKVEHPDLWERACRLDEHIRHGGAFNARGGKPFAGQMFLHADRIPLREVDLRSPLQRQIDSGQGTLFDPTDPFDPASLALDCQAGVCFT